MEMLLREWQKRYARTMAKAHHALLCALFAGGGALGCARAVGIGAPREAPPAKTVETALAPAVLPLSAAPGAATAEAPANAPTTKPAEDGPLTLFAGGDVNLGREVGQRLAQDSSYAPFAGIAELWGNADLRFVNLESGLSDQNGETQSPHHRMIFTGTPAGAWALANAGITAVSTANNHIWDYGRDALFQTLDNLRAAGVAAGGCGRSAEEAYRPIRLQVKGFSVAIFALTHIWNQGPFERHEARHYVAWASVRKLRAALLATRKEVDFLLVSYHGGAEYQDAPSEPTRAFVKAVMDLGADVVLGHHPHVIQGIGWRQGRPVFYSLGNLVFGPRPEHPWTRWGMLAKIRVQRDGARSYAICPYRIPVDLPLAFPEAELRDERALFLRHVRLASTATGGMRFGEEDGQGCVEVLPPVR